MILFLLLLIAVLFTILLFSSKRFSPIPYFPTNKKDLPYIIKALSLKNDQVIFDLGAGDGVVIFEAAYAAKRKNLTTRFVAVEINPILMLVLNIRRLFHPNRKNIKIVYGDMFSMDYSHLTSNAGHLTFYLYISPWLTEKTIKNIQKQFSKFEIVSYMYKMNKKIGKEKQIKGAKHDIFIYSV